MAIERHCLDDHLSILAGRRNCATKPAVDIEPAQFLHLFQKRHLLFAALQQQQFQACGLA